MLTSANTLGGIIIFYPLLTSYKDGDLVATFLVIFLLLLFYNCYSLWIVNVFFKEIRTTVITPVNISHSSEDVENSSEKDVMQVKRF